MDNRLLITGRVEKLPEVVYSPAGIPICRFYLCHESQQNEAGMVRKVKCRLPVVAAGEGLQKVIQRVKADQLIRVSGFLSRSSHRRGDENLELHAESIEFPTQ